MCTQPVCMGREWVMRRCGGRPWSKRLLPLRLTGSSIDKPGRSSKRSSAAAGARTSAAGPWCPTSRPSARAMEASWAMTAAGARATALLARRRQSCVCMRSRRRRRHRKRARSPARACPCRRRRGATAAAARRRAGPAPTAVAARRSPLRRLGGAPTRALAGARGRRRTRPRCLWPPWARPSCTAARTRRSACPARPPPAGPAAAAVAVMLCTRAPAGAAPLLRPRRSRAPSGWPAWREHRRPPCRCLPGQWQAVHPARARWGQGWWRVRPAARMLRARGHCRPARSRCGRTTQRTCGRAALPRCRSSRCTHGRPRSSAPAVRRSGCGRCPRGRPRRRPRPRARPRARARARGRHPRTACTARLCSGSSRCSCSSSSNSRLRIGSACQAAATSAQRASAAAAAGCWPCPRALKRRRRPARPAAATPPAAATTGRSRAAPCRSGSAAPSRRAPLVGRTATRPAHPRRRQRPRRPKRRAAAAAAVEARTCLACRSPSPSRRTWPLHLCRPQLPWPRREAGVVRLRAPACKGMTMQRRAAPAPRHTLPAAGAAAAAPRRRRPAAAPPSRSDADANAG